VSASLEPKTDDQNNITSDSKDVTKAIQLLSECPSWSELDMIHSSPGHAWTERGRWKDPKQVAQIIEYYTKLSQFSSPVLREAIGKYRHQYSKASSEYWSAGSKIYALHRFIFNIPPGYVSPHGNLFGGIVPRTEWKNDKEVRPIRINRLWPFSEMPDKTLQLTDSFSQYMGLDYGEQGEFDYLLKRYGRRHINSPKILDTK